jgi:hypothetical protein
LAAGVVRQLSPPPLAPALPLLDYSLLVDEDTGRRFFEVAMLTAL